MTYYVLIAFCIVILIAYLFDITSRYSKIPGILLLILTGIFIQPAIAFFDFTIPDMSRMLPIMGTLGLILIVLEGSLDLTIRRDKFPLIIGSISSAIVPFALFIGIFSYILANFLGYNLKTAVINIIPLAIISSAVAIPSASNLDPANREFIVYESSMSDIIGILSFDFILLSSGSLGSGIARFAAEFIMTILASIVLSTGLAFILHKIKLHVKYVIIMTVIILVYALAKLIHLPSLLVVFIFGLVMNNNQLFRNRYFTRMIDFEELNVELDSFKNIVSELTFVVRSFFFILFGFYTSLSDLLSLSNLLCSLAISVSIFLLRALFFITVLRTPITPLVFFAPRGLITILLFFSIPSTMLLPFINVGVITQTIFITILVMTLGNMLYQKKSAVLGV